MKGSGVFRGIGAAVAIAVGAAFGRHGVPGWGLHKTRVLRRTSGDTKAGRQMVSRRYRSSGYDKPHQGKQEIARRKRQIERLQLYPVHRFP